MPAPFDTLVYRLSSLIRDVVPESQVRPRKGKGGGYSLRRPPEDVSFGDVIRALDGPLAAVPCVSKTAKILDNLSLADAARQAGRERPTKVRKGVSRS